MRAALATALALALLTLVGGGSRPALAATINVTAGSSDELNNDANCSLREAIRSANTNTAVDACTAGGSGPDTINVPAGTFTLSIANPGGTDEHWALSGDLDITQYVAPPPSVTTSGPVIINGANGGGTIIDGGGIDRVFDVRPNASGATFNYLTIQNGSTTASGGGIAVGNSTSVTLSHVVVAANYATANGGGINNASTLNISNSTIGGDNPAAANTAGAGGGIENAASTGNLTMTTSTISGNYALGTGGAGLDNRFVASLTNVTISGNQATGSVTTAVRGGGARRDGDPLVPSPVRAVEDAMVDLSGLPPRPLAWKQFRALGSAALALCDVAAGALDGYVDAVGIHAPWDYLGGQLACIEAGAIVVDAQDRPLAVADPQARRQLLAAGTVELLDALRMAVPR